MRNRILKSAALMLAVCLPTLARAQQRPGAQHGDGSWEFSLGGGLSRLDGALRSFLVTGAASTRFANSLPSALAPTLAARVGYNFTPNIGLSVGGTLAGGSGVRYLTPDAAVTYTWNLAARTSPFAFVGTELTRIDGINERTTHSTWGAMAGVGLRHMLGENLALRLEGRIRLEGYQELSARNAFTSVVTLGFSYFVGGRRRYFPATVLFLPGTVDTLVRENWIVDTALVTRVDTLRGIVYVTEPSADQLILRVQFETDSTIILPLSRPVLDTVAMAIIATPNSLWEVQGHTDNVGTREHNQILSQGRAQAVVDYLVSRGVDRSIMEARGFGENRPVVSNATAEGRAQNRRVQLRRRPSGAYVVPIP
jgi:outer membrane protein OmpA-like peptidoglycan-associated protein